MKIRILNKVLNIEIKSCQPKLRWKRQEINRVWNEFEKGNIHCWHVNANDNRVNLKTDYNGKLLWAFSEQQLTEQTKYLREIRKDDVVFLYKNEEEGYSGMYQVVGQACLRIENHQSNSDSGPGRRSVNIYLTEGNGKERIMSDIEANRYNLYTAIGNHSGYITCIMMSPLLKSGRTSNPFGSIQLLLMCLQSDNINLLLEFFDSDD